MDLTEGSGSIPPIATNSTTDEVFVTDAKARTAVLDQAEGGSKEISEVPSEPTLELIVTKATSVDYKGTEDFYGPTEGTQVVLESEEVTSQFISIERTSLTDSAQMESTMDNVFESESTEVKHQTTHQQPIIAHYVTSAYTTHSSDVTRHEALNDRGPKVTISSTSIVSVTDQFTTTEKHKSSKAHVTITQNTTTAHDPTSATKGIFDDDSSSPTSESKLLSSVPLASSLVVTSEVLPDHTTTDASRSSQKSSETQSLLEETTQFYEKHDPSSHTQTPSHASESTLSIEQSTFSKPTSTLGSESTGDIVSTDSKEGPVSVSISKHYLWKTSISESTLHSTISSTVDLTTESTHAPLEHREPAGGSVAGVVAGVTVGGLVLIAIVVLLIFYRRQRRKSCDLADQDLKDYRSLMKPVPKRCPGADGVINPTSPFAEFISEDGSSSPFSATNFRARFDLHSNDTSNHTKSSGGPGEIPLEDIDGPSSGYSESYSVNTFRPNNHQKTTEAQMENSTET